MRDKKMDILLKNKWIIFWLVLCVINIALLAFSLMRADIYSFIFSLAMSFYCGYMLNMENYRNKNENR